MKIKVFIAAVLLFALLGFPQASGQTPSKVIPPPQAKMFVAPMTDGFDEYLKAAFEKKKVPIEIVSDKEQADFQINGQSETQKASTAKKVIMWDWRSNEQASIQVTRLQSSEVVFAYSVNKVSSARANEAAPRPAPSASKRRSTTRNNG
jgi:hypothetical protein